MADSTPYSTARPFVGALPTWLNSYDAERLASYKLYEDMYHGTPEAFKLMIRGTEDKPIYVPSAKQIVNTMSRYVGRGWGFSVDPSMGSSVEQTQAIVSFGELFNRERILPSFASNKRFGLIRGDWAWLILADPLKPQGRRISVRSVDPGMVFPLFAEDDPDQQTGVDLIEQFTTPDNKVYIKRQRWLKNTHPLHPNAGNYDAPIWHEVALLEMKDWETKPKVVQIVTPGVLLDPRITALPVYRLRNNEEPGNPWGSSEIRGLERLAAGVNQAVSDQDIALALAGLGMYTTDGGAPVNDDGEEVDWDIGPGKVVEVGTGRSFTRLDGVRTITPSLDHINYLHQQLFRTTGISDVALGQVDVQTAESGIALTLRMAPLLDAASEKDLEVEAVMNNMLFDMRAWFEVYETINMQNVSVVSTFGEKLPQNRTAEFTELMTLLGENLVTKEFVLDQLTKKFGYEFPPNMLAELEAASAAIAAQMDPYGQRLADPEADAEAPAEEEDPGLTEEL